MRPLWSRRSSRFAGRATLPGAVRATAYRALFDLHRMPAEWDGLWWRLGPLGYVEDARDATARPPRTRDWAGTSAVTAALHAALDDPDPLVRRAAVENATLALDRETVERLLRLFDDPAAADDRPAILNALGSARDPRASRAGPRRPPSSLRERSTSSCPPLPPPVSKGVRPRRSALAKLAAAEIPPQPLIAALRAVGELEVADAVHAVRARLNHPAVEVRAAAVGALARIGGDQAQRGPDLGARRRGPRGPAARRERPGTLRAKAAVPPLLEAYRRPETRSEAIAALARVPDARALEVYLDGLGAKNPGVRDECRKALAAIREEVRPQVRDRLTSGTLPAPVVLELGTIYAGDRELAPLFAPVRGRPKPDDYAAFALANRGDPRRGRALFDDPRGVGLHQVSPGQRRRGRRRPRPVPGRRQLRPGGADRVGPLPLEEGRRRFPHHHARAGGRPGPLGPRRRGRGRAAGPASTARGRGMTCGSRTSSRRPRATSRRCPTASRPA